ncbi:MAG: aldo/keto reductase [Clostridiaceae bacterium]|nr:aldo/keto reductase [Clostridiaceae bacterium]
MLMNEYFGRSVSKLGFGAMRFPQKDNTTDQAAVNAMIRTALDRGINYFDTAASYGNGASELALSAALRASGYPRDAYMIADKMPFWKAESPAYLDKIFQKSLDNLGTDYIDFYLLHAMNAESFEKAVRLGALNWINAKKREGKIRHVGFSIHDSNEALVHMLDSNAWDFVQIQLNYLDEKDRPGLDGYNELIRRGIPIIIMEPLKGGVLSDLPDNIAGPFRALGQSNASYAFRWLCEKPGIMTILSGMSAMPQLEENLAIFANPAPLSDAEHAAVTEVCENVHIAQRVGCTGCRYCLPCPKEIPIPDIFKAWNTRALNTGSNWVNGTDVDVAAARTCIRCHVCESRCPQKIAIPDKLAELVAAIG